MNKFLINFYLVIIGILLFAGGILFLLFNHVDTLYSFVPAQSENYLHIQPETLNKLSEGQRKEIYSWLEEHSSISENAWKNILETNTRELGLFSLNGQIFGLVKNSNEQKMLFIQNGISTAYNKQVIYFPHLAISEPLASSLSNEAWFQQIRPKVSFSDFILYSRNLNTLQLNTPLLRNATFPIICLLGSFHDNQVIIDVLGAVGQVKTQTVENPIKILPASAISYFRNLQIEEMAEFSSVADNLEFLTIQKLGGNIEYYKDISGSQVGIAKSDLTVDQVQKAILSSLAQLYPSKKERILPDGSVAINLIADEQTWKFVEFSPGNWILQEKELDEETKLKIALKETKNIFTLTFGAPSLSGENQSKCKLPKFSKNGIIFSKTSSPNFKNVLIQNKNQKKLTICID